MTGSIEIYYYGVPIYKERFRLWEVEEMSWEDKAKSRERQFDLKISRLLKSLPVLFYNQTKIFVTFKSKMNNGEIPDIPEVQEWEGVHEVEQYRA
jgi:hypothetical protein